MNPMARARGATFNSATPPLACLRGTWPLASAPRNRGSTSSDAVVNEVIVTASDRHVPVVIYGGPAEADRAKAIQTNHPDVTLLAGEIDLQTTTAALAQAKALVTGDTATMHLGAGLGVPVGSVGLHPTEPRLGALAAPSNSRVFLPEGSTTACSKHGASASTRQATIRSIRDGAGSRSTRKRSGPGSKGCSEAGCQSKRAFNSVASSGFSFPAKIKRN